MKLPSLQGNLNQPGFFLYAAADSAYFDRFGRSFINSVLTNTNHGLHLHLYNPTEDQIRYCRTHSRVSVTYESVPLDLFDSAFAHWQSHNLDSGQQESLRRTRVAMQKDGDCSLNQRMQKTYFACARFIRLAQLVRPTQRFFALDADAIVRKPLPDMTNLVDLHIYRVYKKDPRFLAGGIYVCGTPGSFDFLQTYAANLTQAITQDRLYWTLDQDLLNTIVPNYRWQDLPNTLIDWHMKLDSVIWTAKGTKKSNDAFVSEQNKYIS
jgi:hypothetical protein